MIDGKYPEGWDPHRDGCWFSDFAQQEFLLPYFDVGGQPIDPYDGGVYSAEDLRRLRRRLCYWRPFFEAKPPTWTVVDSSVQSDQPMKLMRQEILAVLDKTVNMVDRALAIGGAIVFGGD